MKKLIFLISSLLCAGVSTAQDFDVDNILYITPLEEAFMIDKESKYLIKGINPTNTSFYGYTYNIGVELKLSKAFSFSMALDRYESELITYSLEGRYYQSTKKLWGEPMSVNNMSGNYLSMSYTGIGDNEKSPFLDSHKSIRIAYGQQRRFMNMGYVDFSLGFDLFDEEYGIIDRIDENELLYDRILTGSRGIRLSNKSIVGIAFGKKHELRDEMMCPVFKCYEDGNFLFKFNLNQSFDIGFVKQDKVSVVTHTDIEYNMNLNFIIERKIKESPFSIEMDLLFGYNNSSESIIGDRSQQYVVSVYPAIRWYFMQRKEIAEGKSGNNLFGLYTYLGTRFDSKNGMRFDTFLGFSETNLIDLGVNVGFGYQKQVANNIFYDLKVGLGIKTTNYQSQFEGVDEVLNFVFYSADDLFENSKFNFDFEYKVGILF